MKERLKQLRKVLNLTQREFADTLGIKRGTIANYEIGRNEPIDGIIFSICREFNVNEDWLRNGEGPMFVEMTREEEIAAFMGDVLREEPKNFRRRFIDMLSKLDTSDWEALEKMAKILATNKAE